MATRSGIGLHDDGGTVAGIYCHWDGGPEHVGRILATHYTDPDKIRTLIANGACSSLGAEIGEPHPFNDWRPEWCTFYRRDRGDNGGHPVHMDTPDAFYTWSRSSGAEFVYLYTGGRWRFIPATKNNARTDPELWDDVAHTLNDNNTAAMVVAQTLKG